MQHPRDQKDTQNAVREITNWKNKLTTSDWDFHGLKIKNASPGVDPNDYATVSQLPTFTQQTTTENQYYAIVFNSSGAVTIGQTISPYIVGLGREAICFSVMLTAIQVPTTADLHMNVQVKPPPADPNNDNTTFQNILQSDIVLPMNKIGPVQSSTFINPGLIFGSRFLIMPTVTQDGGAGFVTIELIMKRILGSGV